MSSKNDPAFPLTEDAITFKNRDFAMQGLTKLEWFAGMALAGEDVAAAVNYQEAAKHIFDLAEAMLAESEKRK